MKLKDETIRKIRIYKKLRRRMINFRTCLKLSGVSYASWINYKKVTKFYAKYKGGENGKEHFNKPDE